MSYDVQLKFVIDLLREMRISSHIISNPDEYISSELDLGLRRMLHGEENYAALINRQIHSAKHNTIYRFIDEYGCN